MSMSWHITNAEACSLTSSTPAHDNKDALKAQAIASMPARQIQSATRLFTKPRQLPRSHARKREAGVGSDGNAQSTPWLAQKHCSTPHAALPQPDDISRATAMLTACWQL